MIVKILVTTHIGMIDVVAGEVPSGDRLRAAVCQAIRNAMQWGADNGFEHELWETTSIAVDSVTLADALPANPGPYLSWAHAAENIPAGDLWVPRIVYDQRAEGWFWRDDASDDDWNGPHFDQETAAKAACEHNSFHPVIDDAQQKATSR